MRYSNTNCKECGSLAVVTNAKPLVITCDTCEVELRPNGTPVPANTSNAKDRVLADLREQYSDLELE